MEDVSIIKWINDNIAKNGASNFHDKINDYWEDYSYDVRNMILNEINKHIN